MDWYDTIFELIDLRSFSNLWYWLGLSIFWSTLGHWVLGVPHDLLRRARSGTDPEAVADVEKLCSVYVRRLLRIADSSGSVLVAVLSGLLTSIAVLGFGYGVEFAQALLCLALPGTLVYALSLRTARRIGRDGLHGAVLLSLLARHRILVQAVGMVSIFATAVYGMYQNMLIGVYG